MVRAYSRLLELVVACGDATYNMDRAIARLQKEADTFQDVDAKLEDEVFK